MAARLMNGGFRPCGRPFINHLVGTAAVLLRYDLRIEVVIAGLLHAAYSHGWAAGNDAAAQLASIGAQMGNGSPVERRVRAYSQRRPDAGLPRDRPGRARGIAAPRHKPGPCGDAGIRYGHFRQLSDRRQRIAATDGAASGIRARGRAWRSRGRTQGTGPPSFLTSAAGRISRS